jgi:predicted RNase H-like HicB family nuclease
MKAVAIIEKGLDGAYGVFIGSDNVPFGALGDGKTIAEAVADFYNSLDEMRAFYAEEGKEFPQLEFEFRYDTASFLQQYAYAFTLAGLERITGVNQRQLSHYINGVRKPSEKTTRKIEERLHQFGAEIASIRFV